MFLTLKWYNNRKNKYKKRMKNRFINWIKWLPLVALLSVYTFGGQVFGYDLVDQSCGYVDGVSVFAEYDLMGYKATSGLVDFNFAEWSTPDTDVTQIPTYRSAGTVISDDQRVCFDSSGKINSDDQWAWNTNYGWIDFAWCDDPSCEEDLLQVDFPLVGDLVDINPSYTSAYLSGYAWNDAIGWIQFDWDCVGCDITQRPRVMLPTGWPDVSVPLAEMDGYGWSEKAGWIRFGDPDAWGGDPVMVEVLEEVLEPIYVQPVMEISPAPSQVSQHGYGGYLEAPYADGIDDYTISVRLVDIDSGDVLDDSYSVEMNVTPTADSEIYYDQTALIDPGALYFDDVVYDSVDESFDMKVHSWAPTSSLNGYDFDPTPDGRIDYYFDKDSLDPTIRSSETNRYEVENLELIVTGPAEVHLVNNDVFPWDVLSEDWEFHFAPAIDVSVLGYQKTDTEMVTYLETIPDQIMYIQGLVKVWSPIFEGYDFSLISKLYSDTYNYLFDTDGGKPSDNNYVPGVDGSEVVSNFNISGPGPTDPLVDTVLMLEGHVPVEATDTFTGIGYGSELTTNQYTMIVNDAGYFAFTLDDPRFFAVVWELVKELSIPVVNAQSLDPDLTIPSVYLEYPTDAFSDYYIDIENLGGGVSVVGDDPTLSIYLDGVLDAEYAWHELDPSVTGPAFLSPGGFTSFNAGTISGDHTIQVCIDSNAAIVESDEDNNCLMVIFGKGSEVNPIYETEVFYTIVTHDGQHDVKYYSHYIPLSAGDTYIYDVAAYDYKEELVVDGAVTSITAGQTGLLESDEVVVLGDITTIALRNELYERMSSLTKGVSPFYYGGTVKDDMTSSQAVELLDGDLLYFEGGDVVFESLDSTYDQKTIVVENGDVYLDDDFLGDNAVGIMVFNGNVYIHPDVTTVLNVNLYTDGSVISYDGDAANLDWPGYDGVADQLTNWSQEDRTSLLKHQLAWVGSIVSQNTIRGAEYQVAPDGSTVAMDVAREYDLNDLRMFTLCWVATDLAGVPIDQDGDLTYLDGDGPDYGDMEDCPGFNRSSYLSDGGGDLSLADNEPFHLKYAPTPSGLPILGGSQGGGLSLN